jgi:hypothetical protein
MSLVFRRVRGRLVRRRANMSLRSLLLRFVQGAWPRKHGRESNVFRQPEPPQSNFWR